MAYAAYDMPICVEICRAEQKYMPFLGPSPSAISGKNSKAWENIQNYAMLRSGFFSVERARRRSRVLNFFFQDSRIRVNRLNIDHLHSVLTMARVRTDFIDSK